MTADLQKRIKIQREAFKACIRVLEIAKAKRNPTLTRHYTEAELETAFKLIEPHTHWKDPIDTMIRVEDFDRARAACQFYTATTLKIVCGHGCLLRVKADGYRAGPAGDH